MKLIIINLYNISSADNLFIVKMLIKIDECERVCKQMSKFCDNLKEFSIDKSYTISDLCDDRTICRYNCDLFMERTSHLF